MEKIQRFAHGTNELLSFPTLNAGFRTVTNIFPAITDCHERRSKTIWNELITILFF